MREPTARRPGWPPRWAKIKGLVTAHLQVRPFKPVDTKSSAAAQSCRGHRQVFAAVILRGAFARFASPQLGTIIQPEAMVAFTASCGRKILGAMTISNATAMA